VEVKKRSIEAKWHREKEAQLLPLENLAVPVKRLLDEAVSSQS